MKTIHLLAASFLLLLAACDNGEDAGRLNGQLESDRIELNAEFAEPIVERAVIEGEAVLAGALVIRQDTARIETRLAEANALREQARARLDELVRGPRAEQIDSVRASVRGGPRDERRLRRRLENATSDEVRLCRDDDRMTALTTGLAVVTVNHPHGLVPILAGTPLVHLGDALYGNAEIATRSTLDTLADDLQRAVRTDNPPHRASYLTRTLVYDHVWCDPDHFDENGVAGVVQTIEELLAPGPAGGGSSATSGRVAYQPGPSWANEA